MLKNFRLGVRLGLGFAGVVLIFAGVSFMVYMQLLEINASATLIRDITIPKSVAASDIRSATFQMRLSTLRLASHQGDSSKDAELILKHRANLLSALGEFEKLAKLVSFDEENQAVQKIRESLAGLIPLQDQMINHSSSSSYSKSEILDSATKFAEVLIKETGDLMGFENERSKFRVVTIANKINESTTMLVIFMFIAFVLAAGAAVMVTRSITKPVASMIETVKRMADGDLSHRIVTDSNDEIGALQSALGRMSVNLAQMIGEVHASADKLVASATELSGAANEVRHGSETQSESASAMAAALEEMTTSINHISTLSEDARQTSSDAGQTAHTGSKTICTMVSEIQQMADAVSDGAAKAQQLGHESERISAIIHVIRDVADQTNLLALNAAIEAARAGEQGRGFAVVADEVRKLAEKTTASAQEITDMVGSIQGGASAMSTQMETTSKRMQEGMEMAQKAGGTVGEIDTGAQNVVHMIDDVSRALKEQASATQEIAAKVEQIVRMVEENSTAVGSVASSAEGLNTLATTLRGSVERFKVPA